MKELILPEREKKALNLLYELRTVLESELNKEISGSNNDIKLSLGWNDESNEAVIMSLSDKIDSGILKQHKKLIEQYENKVKQIIGG